MKIAILGSGVIGTTAAYYLAKAGNDVTVLTTLMETRLLHGPGRLFEELPKRIATDRMWSSAEFFRAKLDEVLRA